MNILSIWKYLWIIFWSIYTRTWMLCFTKRSNTCLKYFLEQVPVSVFEYFYKIFFTILLLRVLTTQRVNVTSSGTYQTEASYSKRDQTLSACLSLFLSTTMGTEINVLADSFYHHIWHTRYFDEHRWFVLYYGV